MTHTVLSYVWPCILCDKTFSGEPAERARNGPVCKACAKEGRDRTARLRRARKGKKKRGKR